MSRQQEIFSTIRPILGETYGDGSMVDALAIDLSERIERWNDHPSQPSYEDRTREDMIFQTCWNWFSGGSTAESVAKQIEEAL